MNSDYVPEPDKSFTAPRIFFTFFLQKYVWNRTFFWMWDMRSFFFFFWCILVPIDTALFSSNHNGRRLPFMFLNIHRVRTFSPFFQRINYVKRLAFKWNDKKKRMESGAKIVELPPTWVPSPGAIKLYISSYGTFSESQEPINFL